MDGTAYIGLGSNLGRRRAQMARALARLDAALANSEASAKHPQAPGVVAVSRLFETAPLYVVDQPPFLNAAARLDVAMSPFDLLALLNAIEAELGRERQVRFGPRTLDLDILLWEQRPPRGAGVGARPLVVRTPELTVPHPRLLERAFALLPLADVAADVIHPLCHRAIGELVDGGVEQAGAIAVVAEAGWHLPAPSRGAPPTRNDREESPP